MRTNVKIIDEGDYIYTKASRYKTPEELRCELEAHVQQAYQYGREPDGIVILSCKHGREPQEKPYDYELRSIVEENNVRTVTYYLRVC